MKRAFFSVSALIILLNAVLFSLYLAGRFNPEPLVYFIKATIEGKDTSDCLSLPEHIWRRFPQCYPEVQETEIPASGGVDSTEV